MKFVKANGLVIHTLDQGRRDGPPLVFINSLGATSASGTRSPRSSRPISASSLHDKRGHGLSESGPDQNDMADYARDLVALLDSVGVGRATIVGLSIGGLIAQEFYRQRPERVAALVLCDTAAKIGTDDVWDQRIAQVERGGIESLADSVLERWFTAEFPISASRRARRHARHAHANAAPRLSRRLRGLEARRPPTLCRTDRGPDPMPGRRPGRLHARRFG